MLASTIQFTRSIPITATHPKKRRLVREGVEGLIPQSPTVCQVPTAPTLPRFHTRKRAVLRTTPAPASSSSTIPLVNTTNATHTDGERAGCVLLRKEVIQPHLPVRLPCYDFVPIASPTFDGSLHKG